MDLKTDVLVKDGFTVRYNKKEFAPGQTFPCDPFEANRLLDAGVVLLVNREDENDVWYPSPEEIEEARLECVPTSRQAVVSTDNPLVDAIYRLDPDKKNKTIWTRSGVPQTAALTELVGKPVSAADRDIAYASFCKMQSGVRSK